MKEETRQNLVKSDIWMRMLYMLLFAIAYSIAEAVIIFLAIFQCVAVLITGHINEPLLRFGKNLSVFIFDILEFQTFNTELRPFPFSAWPDEEPSGAEWLDDEPTLDDVDIAEDEPFDTKDELKAEFDEQLKADKSSDSQLANESAVDKNKEEGD
jgi:hypothetical protein